MEVLKHGINLDENSLASRWADRLCWRFAGRGKWKCEFNQREE